MIEDRNVYGERLEVCCMKPLTGFFRTGECSTSEEDVGKHTVCVLVTDEFLNFSQMAGNDLSMPIPEYDFPGLVAGDLWCLCAPRWKEAWEAGVAPPVVLAATHEETLNYVPLEVLKKYAVD